MLNLDQVRLLENRVEKAVSKIQNLNAENSHLRSQLSVLQTRVGELEGLVRSFKDDQGRIEEGILNALDRLSAFEDSVFQSTDSPMSEEKVSIEPLFANNDTESEANADESSVAEPEPITIDAEWQKPAEENSDNSNSSSDGQMDIF